jgi:hypothetical protein
MGMKKLKTKIFYCGGTIPVASHQQKGTIEIKDGSLYLVAGGKSAKQAVDIIIPLVNIKSAVPVEKKYYSSVGYFLRIGYLDEMGRDEEIELEIRCFIRRGRTQALMNFWVETLSPRD